jgi:hypothetical protein
VNTRTRGPSVIEVAFALAVAVLPVRRLAGPQVHRDFETGHTSQWDEEHQGVDADDDGYAQSEVKFDGVYAGRFIVAPGDKFRARSGERATLYPGHANYVNQRFCRDDWPASEGGKTASLYVDGTKVGRSRDEVAQ